MSAPPAPLASLLQDGSLSALVSPSVELQPLRTADELAALLLAVRKYPVGLPRRDEMIAVALGGVYTGAQLAALIARLDSAGASLLRVGSSLPQAGDDVYLIPPVEKCVACPHAPLLVVKQRHPSAPTVISETGVFRGVLHLKKCVCCTKSQISRFTFHVSRTLGAWF